VLLYRLAVSVFGLTFAIKLMEAGERRAENSYSAVAQELPELGRIVADETEHESALMELIDEERLGYLSSMVLGINDALVELTGALAGLTFARQSSRLVGLAGLITGVATSLSMAASEYLSTKNTSSVVEAAERPPPLASLSGRLSRSLLGSEKGLPAFRPEEVVPVPG